ncbi:MAG: ribosomal RNA small subunit methyltransferase A [Patescibacteria group bacterium]|nr:ribosomal RNA small subunit methyltransferase A [Patescibacteria group bacterium]
MSLRAKKSLGQHFLASKGALAKIIEAAALHEGETTMEIGPGTGILTEALLGTGARVIAIEKDRRAMGILEERFAGEIADKRLRLIEGDVLETDRAALGLSEGTYAVVANIPYYITGAILGSFLEKGPRPSRMVLLVQKEVAERIVARDGKESVLSISVKAFGRPRIVARVPRGAFVPPPTVDSAIIAIEEIAGAPFGGDSARIGRFFAVVKAGFAHKRKLLKRNLEAVADASSLEKAWGSFGLSTDARAEDVSVETWLGIAESLSC